VRQTFAAAGGRLDSIRLRRVSVRGQAIGFHLDVPTVKTLQLVLNADSEYSGGWLVFATATAGLQIPALPAGSATIYSDDIVHGVTEMQNGVRYSLFLLHLLHRPGRG
jgi:predicted 2-oxoglutarate/Fe(II)-dependent dioxygenase YbiX